MTDKVILTPTVPEDLPHVIGEVLPFRIKALTAKVGDRVIGIGGFGFQPGGAVIAFMQLTPEAYRYPVSMVKAARRIMEMARADGYARVVSSSNPDIESAPRFLERLGFKRTQLEADGHVIHIWSPPE